jgi:nucleotide-binding universal stress UspA family protein
MKVAFPPVETSSRRSLLERQEGAMLPIRTILHPTDFSECSRPAFALACALAQDYGSRIVVVHVAEPSAVVSDFGMLMFPTDLEGKRLRQQLEQLRPEDPRVRVDHRLIQGYAAPEILRVAAEIKCDLILMGTHGRSGLGRLFLGSVAEQVVRRASCPVVTIKVPPAEASPVKVPATAAAGREAAAPY